MKSSSKFFNNNSCEYFPCHKIDNQDEFNCLFCYCPLYPLGKDCGGNYAYTSKGIKDCSNCILPHKVSGYKFVRSKIDKIIDLAKDQ